MALAEFGTSENQIDRLEQELKSLQDEELAYERQLNGIKITNMKALYEATKAGNADLFKRAQDLDKQLHDARIKAQEAENTKRFNDATKYLQLELDALEKRAENTKKLYELNQLIAETVGGKTSEDPEQRRIEAAKTIEDVEGRWLAEQRKYWDDIKSARMEAEDEIYKKEKQNLDDRIKGIELAAQAEKAAQDERFKNGEISLDEHNKKLKEIEQNKQKDTAAAQIETAEKVRAAGDKAAAKAQKLKDRAQKKKDKDAKKKGILDGTQDGVAFKGEFGPISGGAVGDFLSKAKGKSGIDENTGVRKIDIGAAVGAIADLAKQLDGTIEDIQKTQSEIDTRLQGSKNATSRNLMGGQSYWQQMSKDITGIAGVSPLVQQSKIVDNLKTLVNQGISFNVEQRAVMESLKDKIATTFNAANGTLLRLVRIQQQDTTASRLGMESALTSFLNNMYETTEYMQGIADSVKSSIEESMALMDSRAAVEYEYQVQKWMGSLYSVGMDNSSVTNIAQALGQIAAGDISGLTGSGTGNLMVMAANNAGLNLAEILADGLDGSKTNQLMEAMVKYLSKIYDESNNSKVIQQQFASVYGLKASDLKAATNLSSSVSNIAQSTLTYSDSMSQLTSMANSMYQRTSLGEMMSNAWNNFQYTTAAGIANNPAMYAIYKVANLLDATVGGIDLPTISVMGNSIDLPKVSDLLSAGALAGGMISGIGTLISAGGGGGITGDGILKAAGISSTPASVTRGDGGGLTKKKAGATTSTSGYAGNSASGDVYDSTVGGANDDAKAQQAQAKEDNQDATLTDVNNTVGNIYDLLRDVVSGMSSLTVRMVGTAGEGWN